VAGQNELAEIGRKYGVRLMGPNIYGFLLHAQQFGARPSVLYGYRVKGHAALSSQSGRHRYGDHRLLALGQNGVSAIVGLGNKSDIDEDAC